MILIPIPVFFIYPHPLRFCSYLTVYWFPPKIQPKDVEFLIFPFWNIFMNGAWINRVQAYDMAVDALGLAITSRKEEKEEIPSPSDPDVIDADGGIITVICFDMMEYLKRHSSKAVKKTLSIPEWLNEAACSMGLNFSQVLQEALLQKVQSKF